MKNIIDNLKLEKLLVANWSNFLNQKKLIAYTFICVRNHKFSQAVKPIGYKKPLPNIKITVSHFKLKKDALDVVFAQIGTIPADAAAWLTPTTDIPLKSSGSILFFIKDPTNIALNDVGTTISFTVFTSNAQWIVETVVQAAEIIPVA